MQTATKNKGLLSSLTLAQKMWLMILPLLIMTLALLSVLNGQFQSDINLATKEKRGAEYIAQIHKVLLNVSQSSELATLELSGQRELKPKRILKTQAIKTSLEELLKLEQSYRFAQNVKPTSNSTAVDIESLMAETTKLEERMQGYSPRAAFDQHNKIADGLLLLSAQVASESELSLDAVGGTYWMHKLMVDDFNALYTSLSELRGIGTPVFLGTEMELENVQELRILMERIKEQQKSLGNSVEFIERNDISAVAALRAMDVTLMSGRQQKAFDLIENYNKSVQQALSIIDNNVRVGPVSYSAQRFHTAATEALDSLELLARETNALLQQKLTQRSDNFSRSQTFTIGALMVALMALAWLAVNVAQNITNSIKRLATAAQRVGSGDLSQSVQIDSQDELGAFAQTLNSSIQQLKERSEKDHIEAQKSTQLQTNIGNFLRVALEIADGDFTQKGQVTDDVLGNVVDSINLMTENTGYALVDVKKAVESVSGTSVDLDKLSESVEQGAKVQAESVLAARQDTQQLAQTFFQLADEAEKAQNASVQTLEAAQLGQAAVQQTVDRMTDLRSEIASISQEIDDLNKNSKEIGDISRTLEEFASQTNLLALNASFEAAGAGVAGRRFAIIAEEVRRLAEDSAKQTQRVGTIVRLLQENVKNVSAKTVQGAERAENTLTIANDAGERLKQIATLAQDSSSLSSEMASMSKAQTGIVDQVNKTIQEIANTASRTQEATQQSRSSVANLRNLADQLSETIDRFKLPN